MPVDKTEVRKAIKKLYPTVNLSAPRLDELSARMAARLADGADEAAIEESVKDYNSVFAFSEIAAQDDRIRNHEHNKKPAEGSDPKPASPEKKEEPDPTTGTDQASIIAAALAKALGPLQDEIKNLKQQQEGLTVAQRFDKLKAKAAEKKIPDFLLKTVSIGPDYNEDTVLNNLAAEWTEIRQKHFNGGKDYTPPNPDGAETGREKKTVSTDVKRFLEKKGKVAEAAAKLNSTSK